MRQTRLLFLVGLIAAFLLNTTTASCRNILKDILKAYSTYREVNLMLWLTGDVNAEKRFGEEMKWIINLTHKKDGDAETKRWVSAVFDRVKAQYRTRGFNYNITVLRGKDVNAFAIPGGSIYIFRGMLDLVSSDDELAAVLAHELAHAERRHSLQQLRGNAAFQLLLQKAVKKGRDRDTWGQILGALTMLAYSRQHEEEADAIGQERMFHAGFNPAAQVTLWQKFVQRFGSQSGIQTYLGTHPPSQARVDAARRGLAKFQVAETKPQELSLSFNILANVTENLLQNGSFEADVGGRGFPDAWEMVTEQAGRVELYPVTGRYVLELTSDSQMRQVRVVSSLIRIDPNQPLELTGWARTEDGTQNVAVGAELYNEQKRLRGYIWPVLARQPLSSQWTQFNGIFAQGSEQNISVTPDTRYIKIVLQNGPLSRGKVWFDDLRLKKQATKDPENLIVDGSFEYAGANGLPAGLMGTTTRMARDLQTFKIGYASLRVAGAAEEAQVAFTPVALENYGGTAMHGTLHMHGSAVIPLRIQLVLLDAVGNPISPFLLDKEVKTRENLWEAVSFGARLDSTSEPVKSAKAVQLRIVGNIPTAANLWLDGVILR